MVFCYSSPGKLMHSVNMCLGQPGQGERMLLGAFDRPRSWVFWGSSAFIAWMFVSTCDGPGTWWVIDGQCGPCCQETPWGCLWSWDHFLCMLGVGVGPRSRDGFSSEACNTRWLVLGLPSSAYRLLWFSPTPPTPFWCLVLIQRSTWDKPIWGNPDGDLSLSCSHLMLSWPMEVETIV